MLLKKRQLTVNDDAKILDGIQAKSDGEIAASSSDSLSSVAIPKRSNAKHHFGVTVNDRIIVLQYSADGATLIRSAT